MGVRAFLSFVQEDLNLVNLFRGQAKGDISGLDFADYSVKEPFDSRNAEYIGRGITEQIKLAQLTICLCGPTTYESDWVNWELKKSIELGKPIMGVYLYGDSRIKCYPAPLKGCPMVQWNTQDIMNAMNGLLLGANDYATTPDRNTLFVQRVEEIAAREASAWYNRHATITPNPHSSGGT